MQGDIITPGQSSYYTKSKMWFILQTIYHHHYNYYHYCYYYYLIIFDITMIIVIVITIIIICRSSSSNFYCCFFIQENNVKQLNYPAWPTKNIALLIKDIPSGNRWKDKSVHVFKKYLTGKKMKTRIEQVDSLEIASCPWKYEKVHLKIKFSSGHAIALWKNGVE